VELNKHLVEQEKHLVKLNKLLVEQEKHLRLDEK